MHNLDEGCENIFPPDIFVSALITLFIASLTVSIRVVKIACANPVESLRYE